MMHRETKLFSEETKQFPDSLRARATRENEGSTLPLVCAQSCWYISFCNEGKLCENPRRTYRSFHKVRRTGEATALDERYLEHKTKRTPLTRAKTTFLSQRNFGLRSHKSRQLAGLSRRSSLRRDKYFANCDFFIRYLLQLINIFWDRYYF